MNAYELADKLQELDSKLHLIDLFKSADMLRQQADRIGVLEANHEIQKNINEKALQYIEHLEQGLRASIDLNNAQATRTTPQTKPLSDEEIIDCVNKEFDLGLKAGHATVLAFARAIEAKVRGEK